MAAIVTNKFRVLNAENFKTDLLDTATSTYAFIAKSDAWSDDFSDITDAEAPTPLDQQSEELQVHDNMIAMKRVTGADVTHVIPRHNWVAGTTYYSWDDADVDIYDNPFYVLTDEFKVYKCIQVGTGSSTQKPVQTDTQYAIKEGDGYVWKYMYTLQAADSDKFLTNFYIPVKTIIDNGPPLAADDQTQYNGQVDAQAAGIGKIYDIVVVDGGINYSANPVVTINGDGTGADILDSDVTVVGGVITSIKVRDATNWAAAGSNYTQANVVITDTTGEHAQARAVISPGFGHGVDPVRELGAFYIATNAKLEYDAGTGDFIVDNAFRQVGLIRNPLNFAPATNEDIATATYITGLQSMVVDDSSGINPGDVLQGASSTTATVLVDSVDSATHTVKYHQNFKTAWYPLTTESIHNLTTAANNLTAVSSFGNPEYDRYSGQIIFVENRAPVNRSSTQIEDVKIIIEF